VIVARTTTQMPLLREEHLLTSFWLRLRRDRAISLFVPV
jgi:hypothetical protein